MRINVHSGGCVFQSFDVCFILVGVSNTGVAKKNLETLVGPSIAELSLSFRCHFPKSGRLNGEKVRHGLHWRCPPTIHSFPANPLQVFESRRVV